MLQGFHKGQVTPPAYGVGGSDGTPAGAKAESAGLGIPVAMGSALCMPASSPFPVSSSEAATGQCGGHGDL